MAEPALTEEGCRRVAVACDCDGVDQHVAANILGVNVGRVNEAVMAIRLAVSNPKRAIEVMRAAGMQVPML